MKYNNITDTLDLIEYVSESIFYMKYLDEYNKIIHKSHVILEKQVNLKTLFNPINNYNNSFYIDEIIIENDEDLDSLTLYINTYKPSVIYVNKESLLYIINKDKFNNTDFNNTSKFGLFLNNVEEFEDFLLKASEFKNIRKQIVDIIIKDFSSTKKYQGNSLFYALETNIIKSIRYGVQEVFIILPDNRKLKDTTLKQIEVGNRINLTAIEYNRKINKELPYSRCKINDKVVGIEPQYRNEDFLDENWGIINISKASPYFGNKIISRDGGKTSEKKILAQVMAGYSDDTNKDSLYKKQSVIKIIDSIKMRRK